MNIRAVQAIGVVLCGFTVVLLARSESLPRALAAAAEIHYAPTEDLESLDIGLIGSAGSSIDLAAYVLTDERIIAALAAAGRRGVAVRIWQDAGESTYGRERVAAAFAVLPSVSLREKPERSPLMHLKSYCVDGATLRTGSANFSRSGETAQDNDLIILRGPRACDGFEHLFEAGWSSGAAP